MKRSLVLAAFGAIALAASLARADVLKPISKQEIRDFRAASKAHARANLPAGTPRGYSLSMPASDINRVADGRLQGDLKLRAVTRATPNRGAIQRATYLSVPGDATTVTSGGWKKVKLNIPPNARQR